ncbi:MAG TPA: transglutaminase-like domain-containing protein [Burkholderiales bacterium]|nr:transglutaminase-like domain-containing protein [Burkholderiales bacterium]
MFNGAKVGFTHLALEPASDAPGRYEIDSEAAMRLHFLGVDKRINLRAHDRVRDDLTLESFAYEQDIDGSVLRVSGRADRRRLEMTVEAAGSRETRSFALAAPLYPSSALDLLPVLHGMRVGETLRYLVFNGETQTVDEARQEVAAFESSTLFEGRAFRVTTSMLGLDTTSWITPDGRPLLELSSHGTLVSALEDEASARHYLVAASLNKDDALLDYSILRSAPIAEPRSVARMRIVLEGVPPDFPLAGARGQSCVRSDTQLACTVDRGAFADAGERAPPPRYLRPSLAAPSEDGQIVLLARSIAPATLPPAEAVHRIIAWMDANIAKQATDSFTAVDVLRTRRAECQGHAYLFAALSRALGIPTRVVNGLVYSAEHGGFLYHSWDEVWLAGESWRPVDPTFGQPLADATHLELLEGESLGELTPLARLVGRLRLVSARAEAHW